jgi:hypothetical protein
MIKLKKIHTVHFHVLMCKKKITKEIEAKKNFQMLSMEAQ